MNPTFFGLLESSFPTVPPPVNTVLVWSNQISNTTEPLEDCQRVIQPDGSIILFAVGRSVFARSIDGINWTIGSTPLNGIWLKLHSFLLNPTTTRLIISGEQGRMFFSDNLGGTWTSVPSGTTVWIRDIAGDVSELVAVGNSNYLSVSTDGGLTWSARTSGQGAGTAFNAVLRVDLPSVRYLVAGAAGVIISSADTITWVTRQTAAFWTIQNMVQTPTYIIACAVGGDIYRSDDGITWLRNNTGWNATQHGIARTSTHLVIVGVHGALSERFCISALISNPLSWVRSAIVNHQEMRDVSNGISENSLFAVSLGGHIISTTT